MEDDVRLLNGVILNIANTMVGLAIRDNTVVLTFQPVDPEQVLKLHNYLADQINKGGIDVLLAPLVAHGSVSVRKDK